jgi:hypothetical protein
MNCFRLAVRVAGLVDSCFGKGDEGQNLYFALLRKRWVQAYILVVVLLVVCPVWSFVEECEADSVDLWLQE